MLVFARNVRRTTEDSSMKKKVVLAMKSHILIAGVTGALGFALGSFQGHSNTIGDVQQLGAISKPAMMFDHVEVLKVHPAGLYLRTESGKPEHFLMDPLDQHWTDTLVKNPGKRWHVELEPSRTCQDRYILSTLVSD